MMKLIEGQKYRLPNGEKVTAALVEGRFILEYKRQYRPALSIAAEGRLYLRGEQTGLSVDSLEMDTDESD